MMSKIMNFQEKIKYKIVNKSKINQKKVIIKLFNDSFVKNNKNNFNIIYNDKELSLISDLEILNDKKSSIIEIILKQTNEITDISKMFSECEELYSFSGLSKLDIENVKDISELFTNCKLINLPDISKWNTSNINNMSGIFRGCFLLYSLPDISKWNTSNVTNFSSMFMGCSNLEELPDISKWDTLKCKEMNNMFMGCSKLKKFPDISKWDVSSVTNMNSMFYGCSLISNLPDISKWNTKNVVNMSQMFLNCSGLNSLPELDKWDTSNLKKYSLMFSNCKTTLNYPAFTKKNVQQSEHNNSTNSLIKPKSELFSNINDIKKPSNINNNDINKKFLKPCYSKNFLCCYKCKNIPEIIIKNSEEAILNCDFCGFTEKVKISDIINISTKWMDKNFYKCSIHDKTSVGGFECKYCQSCDLFICENCEENHINNELSGRNHELKFINDLDIIFCEKHSLKSNKFCNTCKKYICNNCLKIEHKIHDIRNEDDNNKLNLNFLQNFYEILEKGKNSKKNIIDKIIKYSGNYKENLENKNDFIFSSKKIVEEIENYKKLGKILYYSSKKIKPGKYKEEILQNYLNIFNYICDLFKEEKIKGFNTLMLTKMDEIKIISKNLSNNDKKCLKENIKNNFKPYKSNISDLIKKKSFIENNLDFSRTLKKYIIIEKKKNPKNFINMDEVLKDTERFLDGIDSVNSDFILSVIGKCAQNNGTEVYITKKSSEDYKNLELASVQSLFILGTQKKYEFHLNFGEEENEKILNYPELQNKFIKKYKQLIAKELKIDEKYLILQDIHRGSLAFSFLQIKSPIDLRNSISNLKGKYNIENIEQKPLLETIQISSNILDFDNIDKSNSDRRDNWKEYGLKVKGMYDNGKDNWIDDTDKKSEFINAYLGINNYLGDSSKMLLDLQNLTENLEKKHSSNRYDDYHIDNSNNEISNYIINDYISDTGRNYDLSHSSRSNDNDNSNRDKIISNLINKNYIDDVYLFENIEFAENFAGIIDISGYQIKVILMCKIRKNKIKKHEDIKDCYILNPTPDEIRPYRILIKIIPNSPLTDGSFLTICLKPVDYVLNIFKSKDYSFYNFRKDKKYSKYSKLKEQFLKNDFFAMRIYTANEFYRSINGYLRDKTNLEENPKQSKMPLAHIKSFICCLQESLKKNKNVEDNLIVYRGIDKLKLPNDIGIGSRFYFREFISTSRKKEEALKFINSGKGSLFIIKISNNSKRNYCFDVADYSVFPTESEIVISSFCFFMVTEIDRKEKGTDIINLECIGFLFDNL